MAFRKKYIRRKRFARKKRGVKRRTFKRYTKKRIVRKRRVTRRGKMPRINASLNMARFKIRINRREMDLGDDPEIIPLGNAADLDFQSLADNLPLLRNYNQWRIDKIVTHWRCLNKTKGAWRGDLVNHALVYNVPNDSLSSDGALENLMFNTDTALLNNYLQNYTELRGVNFKKVSWQYGSRTYRPYVTELYSTYAKTSSAAPSVIQDVRRNYSKVFRYASSAVRYEAPLYLLVPGLTKTNYDITGKMPVVTGGATTIVQSGNLVDLDMVINEFPKLEIWSEVYVTAKQYSNFSSSNPPARIFKKPKMEPMANTIDVDFNKVKQDVQESVMDQITGSHPVIAAVATVAGLRKRPRDEFKM